MNTNLLRYSVLVFIYAFHIASCAKIALIIIDVQNCFLSGGSLAVSEGDDVIPVINEIRSKYESQFSLVVLTQDWHCVDHVSFASQHSGSNVYDVITLQYGADKKLCVGSSCDVRYNVSQTLWPDHCVINTTSAEFSRNLTKRSSDIVVRKGNNCEVDSYSGFFDNGDFEHTELHSLLNKAGIDTVFVMGLATDYCVYYTSLDAQQLGYTTYMVEDASRGVAPNTVTSALDDMRKKGIKIIQSSSMTSILSDLTSSATSVVTSFSQTMITFSVLALLKIR